MLTIKNFKCNSFQENCYVVSDETKDCVIIDCGALHEEERIAISEYISSNSLKPVHSLLTHAHVDHTLGVKYIYDRYGLAPELQEKDVQLLEQFQLQAEMLCNITIDYALPTPSRLLEDNDTIEFGNHSFRVIETPGHSRGSVFYYCEDEKVCFSGDTLFKGSIGRTDLPGGSMFQIIQSLRMVTQLPDDVKVYSGHGEETTIGFELASNPYLDR